MLKAIGNAITGLADFAGSVVYGLFGLAVLALLLALGWAFLIQPLFS